MRVRQSLVRQTEFSSSFADSVMDDAVVFVDTNILAWAFELSEPACKQFMLWCADLQEENRLAIPAWVVHEYNYLISRDGDGITSPYRGIAKPLQVQLAQLKKGAHQGIGDDFAREMGFANRAAAIDAIDGAAATLTKVAGLLSKKEGRHHLALLAFYEDLIDRCALDSDIQLLSYQASLEAPSRLSGRLSPGGMDAGKSQNAHGDLILWKEILSHCEKNGIKKAAILTNDVKQDWVYIPKKVVLKTGAEVSGYHSEATYIRLPNPDLVDEFRSRTGSDALCVFSFPFAVQCLGSVEMNPFGASKFTQLTLAMQAQRSPTDLVVHWYVENQDSFKEALHGVCHWQASPSEVDLNEFAAWTTGKMGHALKDVDWTQVFIALFI